MCNFTGLFMCRSFHILLLGGVGFIGVARLPAAPAESMIIERGPHHAVHHWTTEEVWPDGQSQAQEHYVVELASGLNFFKDGQWVESVLTTRS